MRILVCHNGLRDKISLYVKTMDLNKCMERKFIVSKRLIMFLFEYRMKVIETSRRPKFFSIFFILLNWYLKTLYFMYYMFKLRVYSITRYWKPYNLFFGFVSAAPKNQHDIIYFVPMEDHRTLSTLLTMIVLCETVTTSHRPRYFHATLFVFTHSHTHVGIRSLNLSWNNTQQTPLIIY